MANLIRLTQADSGHSQSFVSHEVTVNVFRILMIEDYEGPNDAHSRIVLENGKSLFVTETQDEIRDLANGTEGIL